MSGMACYPRVVIVAAGLVAWGANGLAGVEQQAGHQPAQAAKPAPRPTPVAVPPAPNAGAKSTPKPAVGDAETSARDAVRRIETLMAAESGKTASQKPAAKPTPEAAPPATGTGARGAAKPGARGTSTSAEDVVRRIETLMATESAKNTSATSARRAASTAARKPKPTPLLRWGASLAPGNVTLVWGSELLPAGAASWHAGIRLVWPTDEPAPPHK